MTASARAAGPGRPHRQPAVKRALGPKVLTFEGTSATSPGPADPPCSTTGCPVRAFAHRSLVIPGSHISTKGLPGSRRGRWLIVHNGFIDFAAIKRDLVLAVDESLFPEIKGQSDTEVLVYLALTFGLERTIRRMLARASAVDADRLPATQSSSEMQSGSVAAFRVRAYAYPASFGAAPGRSLSPGTATYSDQSVPPADHSCRGEISGSHGVCRRPAQRACSGAQSCARDRRSLGRLDAVDPDLAGGSVSVAVALTAAAAGYRSPCGCSARPGPGRAVALISSGDAVGAWVCRRPSAGPRWRRAAPGVAGAGTGRLGGGWSRGCARPRR